MAVTRRPGGQDKAQNEISCLRLQDRPILSTKNIKGKGLLSSSRPYYFATKAFIHVCINHGNDPHIARTCAKSKSVQ